VEVDVVVSTEDKTETK